MDTRYCPRMWHPYCEKKKKFRALHFTRLVYCQQLSAKIPNYHTQTLNFTLTKDVKRIQTTASTHNISERYEYVTLHMNNRNDRLAFADGSKIDFSSLKSGSQTAPT